MVILDMDQLSGPVGLDWIHGEVLIYWTYLKNVYFNRKIGKSQSSKKGKSAVQMLFVPSEVLREKSSKAKPKGHLPDGRYVGIGLSVANKGHIPST